MTPTELITIAVERGIAGVQSCNYDQCKERGAIAGFKRCLELTDIQAYKDELAVRHDHEDKWRTNWNSEVDDLNVFWEYRYFTLQVEYIYRLLCAAYHINKYPGYEELPAPYARSILAYSQIVGVKDNETNNVTG